VSLAAGVLAIGLCVSPAAAASGSPRERAALTCQDVYFMGARGSAEPPQPGKPGDPKLHGLGPEVHSMAVRVQAVLKAYGVKNFETLSIGYPADDPAKDLTPTKEELDDFTHGRIAAGLLAYYKSSVQRYLGSISEGVTSALSEVVYVHRECPHALLVLAGYSQGAMVMHQVELRLKATHDTAVLRQITGTLLLGDGDRVSHTAAREFGTSTDRSQGIRTYLRHNSGKDIPDPAATANICDSGDIVCDFGIKTAIEWSKGIAIHTSYMQEPGLLDAAATWIGQLTARRASPGRTVLLPTVAPVAGCSATVAQSASSDARYILLAGCTGVLVRFDRYTGAKVVVTTSKYPMAGGVALLSGDGGTATYTTSISGRSQVVSRNVAAGKTSIVSSASYGAPANASAGEFAMSPNGQWVLFASTATNLVPGVKPGGTGDDPNLFRKNVKTGALSLAVPTDGPPNGGLSPDGISNSGLLAAFEGQATNITGIAPSTGLRDSVYLRDLNTKVVQRLLYQPAGTQTQGSMDASVSADGTKAAFLGLDSDGFAANVVTCTMSAGLAKPSSCKLTATAFPAFDLHLSASGTALEYSAANTPVSATRWEVFSVGFNGGANAASVNNADGIANTDTGNVGAIQGISGDGATVFFSSSATNLDLAATDGQVHAYIRT